MNNKQLDGFYFERFLALSPDLVGASIVPDEAPDFICRIAHSRALGRVYL